MRDQFLSWQLHFVYEFSPLELLFLDNLIPIKVIQVNCDDARNITAFRIHFKKPHVHIYICIDYLSRVILQW